MNAVNAKQLKAELRTQCRAYRTHLRDETYAEKSRKICDQIMDLPEVAIAETVHVYWPLVERREIDTRALIAALQAQKKQIVLPVVLTFGGRDGSGPRLAHRRLDSTEALVANQWGILEPVHGAEVAPEGLDVVLVPALGAGRNRHRLGTGSGFYDAFLSGVEAPAIGLVYAACVFETVPAEPHDIPLVAIVTESEIVR